MYSIGDASDFDLLFTLTAASFVRLLMQMG